MGCGEVSPCPPPARDNLKKKRAVSMRGRPFFIGSRMLKFAGRRSLSCPQAPGVIFSSIRIPVLAEAVTCVTLDAAKSLPKSSA